MRGDLITWDRGCCFENRYSWFNAPEMRRFSVRPEAASGLGAAADAELERMPRSLTRLRSTGCFPSRTEYARPRGC